MGFESPSSLIGISLLPSGCKPISAFDAGLPVAAGAQWQCQINDIISPVFRWVTSSGEVGSHEKPLPVYYLLD